MAKEEQVGPSTSSEVGEEIGRPLNREVSWLDFNQRVLALAADPKLPLLDRVKFLAIFGSNLDEFFQVRVAGLRARNQAGIRRPGPDGRTPGEQLQEIRARVKSATRSAADLFDKELRPVLASQDIHLLSWDDLKPKTQRQLGDMFDSQIFPTLTPLAVDPAHPFPYISNLSLNMAVMVRDSRGGEQKFARVKVPPLLPRFLPLRDGKGLVPVEEVIGARLGALFPGMEVLSHHLFRVTRDANLGLDEDEADDLLVAMESELRRRHRGSQAIRLEVGPDVPEHVRELLVGELELESEDVYVVQPPLDLTGLWEIVALKRPELKTETWVPQTQPALRSQGGEPVDFFSLLKERDVLVHHPYDSFETSFQAFLEQAASDPNVVTIKQTLYRTSGGENPIVHTLVRAAESGKQVVALIEVKARFDEQANIEWARQLEQAGVHVVYGLVGLKTHMKAALVIRREDGLIRRYCHVGTGNYNPATAHLYEDIGIFSASEELGADLGELFNHLTGYSRQGEYRRVLVAPDTLRPRLVEMIRGEIEAPDGQITLKVNALSDPGLIDALYEASQAGVRVDLLVRGICCLRPGVPGLSENIRVRSILGQFLEHSRIFRFGTAERGYQIYVGSADPMTRKLDRRVELLVPVEDPELCQRTNEILELCMADDKNAWELSASGAWTHVPEGQGLSVQERLQELALNRAEGERGAAD